VSIPSVKIGLVNGCFDRFHPGHARFLWEAKKHCTYLIAAVNDDASVRQLKGPSRPFDTLHYRMDRVSAYADQTVPFDGDVAALLALHRPHVVIRGWDQKVDIPGPDAVVLSRYGEFSTSLLEKA
jgi:D-beta-D-heptose 7-phosphate kinase / D-beta-D-heptose 1-phosphate adenosyltransferase